VNYGSGFEGERMTSEKRKRMIEKSSDLNAMIELGLLKDGKPYLKGKNKLAKRFFREAMKQALYLDSMKRNKGKGIRKKKKEKEKKKNKRGRLKRRQ
jgi:hypothetical protein